MSIVAAAEPEGSALGLLIAALAGVVAVGVAALTGVLRPAALGLERRVPPDRPLMPLVGVLFAGLVVWLVLPSLYLELGPASPVMPPKSIEPGDVSPPKTQRFTTSQLVTIGAAVPLIAFGVLWAGNVIVRRRVGQRLGFGTAHLPAGALWGAVGIGLALPFVYGVMVLSEWIYQLVRYEHPSAHDLLKAMDETRDPWVKYLAIFVAVVVAPLWEELLFRGHVQTLIREGLIRLRDVGRTGFPAAGFPVVGAGPAETLPPLAVALDRPRAHPAETWVAIVLASLVFASVHQPWQFPPIFALSLCLGLAYERTGNLWVPVVMHASFNGIMTGFFLFLRGAPD